MWILLDRAENGVSLVMYHPSDPPGFHRVVPLLVASFVVLAACGSDSSSPRGSPTTQSSDTGIVDEPVSTSPEPSDTLRPPEQTVPTPTTSDPSTSPAVPTTIGATSTTTPTAPSSEPVTLTPTQQSLADVAIADLAERRGIDASDIGIVEVAEVTWSDASLGCPQRDMQYQQVLTPGIRVILEASGQRAFFHGTSVGDLAYCATPRPPTGG